MAADLFGERVSGVYHHFSGVLAGAGRGVGPADWYRLGRDDPGGVAAERETVTATEVAIIE